MRISDITYVMPIHMLIVASAWTLADLLARNFFVGVDYDPPYLGCIFDLDNLSYPLSSISSVRNEIHYSLPHHAMTFGTEDGEIVDELV